MTRPFFFVLVDIYNLEEFIEQALRSALEQDFPAADRGILVVDDGPTDHTWEILRRFATQVRVLLNHRIEMEARQRNQWSQQWPVTPARLPLPTDPSVPAGTNFVKA